MDGITNGSTKVKYAEGFEGDEFEIGFDVGTRDGNFVRSNFELTKVEKLELELMWLPS
jgi:hypothetical protein